MPSAMASVGSVVVTELWVYPVKACRGVKVQSAVLTPTGLELDRSFCIVDVDGTNVAKFEAASMRKIPMLCTIGVSVSPDLQSITLDAPGMASLTIPASAEAYRSEPDLTVECSGKSTTSGGGWSFGFIAAKEVRCASDWLNAYLNREVPSADADAEKGGKWRRIVSDKKPTRYALCRATGSLAMADFQPALPHIARSKIAGNPMRARYGTNRKQFADFAPLLLLNQRSCDATGPPCGMQSYPSRPFRANLVVDGPDAAAPPWDEESWSRIRIMRGGAGVMTLHKIKESARCTVPCRDADTSLPLVGREFLKLWKVLTAHDITHHITSHHVTSRHITSHCIASHRITSHRITSHRITSHHITSQHITLHHTTSHHIASHRITSHRIASHHITSHHITSHHNTSYSIIFDSIQFSVRFHYSIQPHYLPPS